MDEWVGSLKLAKEVRIELASRKLRDRPAQVFAKEDRS
jgi:hypothetical protein